MVAKPFNVTVVAILLATAATFAVVINQAQATQAQTAVSDNLVDSLPASFADTVEAVRGAVVNISISGNTAAPGFNAPEFDFPPGSPLEEFFERYFGQPQVPGGGNRSRPFQAVGSGFIIDPDGWVVTNHHVVSKADDIEVILDDGRSFPATVKGTDEKTDLAVLKVETDEPLPFVRFGDSDQARVGDWIIAIGNPFGLGGTTTTGIISARGRHINAGPLDDFIQIDAPINRGNSGGPLFNRNGEVIGVNAAIYSPNGGNVGIGFAIPSAIASDVVNQLRTSGVVERGWLGIQIQTVTGDIAEGFGLDEERGALVADVEPGSPAERAGLAAGDVIVEYDGKAVSRMHDLPKLVAATRVDSEVPVVVIRNGERLTLNATITATAPATEAVAVDESAGGEGRLGINLAPLDESSRQQFGLGENSEGVLITDVEPGSPAARQGIRSGDVITRVGNTRVDNPDQVVEAVRKARKLDRGAVVLGINRQGQTRFVAVPMA